MDFRWGNRPIDEAETFGQIKVVDYLKNYEKTSGENGRKKIDRCESSDKTDGVSTCDNSKTQCKSSADSIIDSATNDKSTLP
jgi:hypothetical protein